ncbi:MAG TPA: hypothetical protein VFV71_00450 [Burkholderiales bacterium]|nr:hypothetical protein [Burkholderiales bacterium]
MRRAAAGMLLALAAAACVPGTQMRTGPAPVRGTVLPVESDAERFASYCDRVLPMKGAELSAELDRARTAFDADKSELNRLQLALVLSLPGTPWRDDAAAVALLSPLVRDGAREGSGLRPLAMWLQAHLVESHRTEEALQLQNARLKDEQRRAEVLQQKADALQQKLEALLDMEMKMIEREQTLPKKK